MIDTRQSLNRELAILSRALGVPVRGALEDVGRAAGVSVSDLEALLRGALLPTTKDLGSLQAIEGAMGLQPGALLCREMGFIVPRPATKAANDSDTESGQPLYRFIMSTNEVDRARDVVEQNWDFAGFMRNPVALFNHNSWDHPIGTWQDLTVEGDTSGAMRLLGYFKPHASALHPRAALTAEQVRDGVLRACSVGFMPGEWRPRGGLPEAHPLFSRNGGYILGSKEAPNRLMECSICTIPMNPGATRLPDDESGRPGKSFTPTPKAAGEKPQAEPTPLATALGRAFQEAKEAENVR